MQLYTTLFAEKEGVDWILFPALSWQMFIGRENHPSRVLGRGAKPSSLTTPVSPDDCRVGVNKGQRRRETPDVFRPRPEESVTRHGTLSDTAGPVVSHHP